MAVERDALADGAAPPQRQEDGAAPREDARGGHALGGVPARAGAAENLAGDREIPITRWCSRRSATASWRRWTSRGCSELLGRLERGEIQVLRARHGRAEPAVARAHQRQPVRVPRRRAARGAPHARGVPAPRPARPDRQRGGRARSGGDRVGDRGRWRRWCATSTSCTTRCWRCGWCRRRRRRRWRRARRTRLDGLAAERPRVPGGVDRRRAWSTRRGWRPSGWAPRAAMLGEDVRARAGDRHAVVGGAAGARGARSASSWARSWITAGRRARAGLAGELGLPLADVVVRAPGPRVRRRDPAGWSQRGRGRRRRRARRWPRWTTTEGLEDVEWCNRRVLARIHRLTLAKLRRRDRAGERGGADAVPAALAAAPRATRS